MAKYERREFRLGEYYLGQRSGSTAWYRCWVGGKGTQRISLGTNDFEEAKEKLIAWYAEQYQLTKQDAPASQVKLGHVIADYWNGHASGVRSAKTIQIMLRYWNEWWGDVTIADLKSPVRQEQFRAHLSAKGLNETSVSRCLEAGRAAIRRAWKRGHVSSVPHIEVPPAGETEPKGRPLTVEEIGKLLSATDEPHMQLFILLMLGTVARPEAVCTLTWEQVDKSSGLIRLNPAGRKQTSKRRPVVRLPKSLEPFLGANGEARVLMFRGKPVGKVTNGWRKMVGRSKIDGNVTPYSLRHTAARWMRMKGVPMEQIAGQLGHKIPSFGMSERYAPHDPAYLREALAALEELLALVIPAAHKLARGTVVGQTEEKMKKAQKDTDIKHFWTDQILYRL